MCDQEENRVRFWEAILVVSAIAFVMLLVWHCDANLAQHEVDVKLAQNIEITKEQEVIRAVE
jgi:hypothetical protein